MRVLYILSAPSSCWCQLGYPFWLPLDLLSRILRLVTFCFALAPSIGFYINMWTLNMESKSQYAQSIWYPCLCCVSCTHTLRPFSDAVRPTLLWYVRCASTPTTNSLASKSFSEMIMITEVYHSLWQRMSERTNTPNMNGSAHNSVYVRIHVAHSN